MTCLLALRIHSSQMRLHDRHRVSGVTDGGAKYFSQVDEVLHCRAVPVCHYGCLCLMILHSQIAEHVGGSVDGFVQQMNTRAQELDVPIPYSRIPLTPDDNQHTTAPTTWLIMQAAIQNESFRTIAAATSYTIPATNKAAAQPDQHHHDRYRCTDFMKRMYRR